MQVKLPRSHGGETNCPIELPLIDQQAKATLHFKRYPTDEPWQSVVMTKRGQALTAELPYQPPAGKITYYINLVNIYGARSLGSEENPIIIRFKADVPTYILAPHIFFMFISMLLSVVAAVEAYFKTSLFRKLCFITTGSLVTGGLILGPIVQKFAFGVYWAGFPYDWDLTDNKLLISALFCVLASVMNIKKARPAFVILASIVLMAMYSIPHSTMGSQYDYKSKSMQYK